MVINREAQIKLLFALVDLYVLCSPEPLTSGHVSMSPCPGVGHWSLVQMSRHTGVSVQVTPVTLYQLARHGQEN